MATSAWTTPKKRSARADATELSSGVVAQIRLIREGGEKVSYPVLFLDVYAQRDGRWQMVAWQATRIPE